MRPFGRLCPRRSLSISLRSCIFLSCLNSNSSRVIAFPWVFCRKILFPFGSFFFVVILQGFLFFPLREREEMLKFPRFPHSCRWAVHSSGNGVFGSPLLPTSGLSWCSRIATEFSFITSHLCRWSPGSFHPASWSQFGCWRFRSRSPRRS